MKCPYCGNDMPDEPAAREREFSIYGDKIYVEDQVHECPSCMVEWSILEFEAPWLEAERTYRKNHNLLAFDQITAWMEQEKLSREEVTFLLGGVYPPQSPADLHSVKVDRALRLLMGQQTSINHEIQNIKTMVASRVCRANHEAISNGMKLHDGGGSPIKYFAQTIYFNTESEWRQIAEVVVRIMEAEKTLNRLTSGVMKVRFHQQKETWDEDKEVDSLNVLVYVLGTKQEAIDENGKNLIAEFLLI